MSGREFTLSGFYTVSARAGSEERNFGERADLVRPVGTYLLVRRMYETMAVWETEPALAAGSNLEADFANVWQTADKIVYSTTLDAVSTTNTRLERRFEPDAIRAMVESAVADVSIAGPTLAADAFDAGLVDECHLFVCPVLVGGGKPGFPCDARIQLELQEERRLGDRCTCGTAPRSDRAPYRRAASTNASNNACWAGSSAEVSSGCHCTAVTQVAPESSTASTVPSGSRAVTLSP